MTPAAKAATASAAAPISRLWRDRRRPEARRSRAVTPLDWLIVAFTLVLALAGARQGFVVGALSLAGFAVGAVLGTRLAPLFLPEGSRSPYAPLLGLAGALVVGGLLAGGFGGFAERVRAMIRVPGFSVLDGGLGA